MPGDEPLSISGSPYSRNNRLLDSNSPSGLGPIQVAAVDIGSNSIHLLVASIEPSLHSFNIEIAEKATTRLGERDPDSGDLTHLSIEKSLDALKRFKAIIESNNVEHLVVIATSAVREALNGREFLKTIKERLGFDVDLISGQEEARLIYLGVLSAMSFVDRPHLLLDIGGGSTELILADAHDARALTSTRVGAVRLNRDFLTEDIIPLKRRKFLKTFIKGSLEPAIYKVLTRISPGEKPVMVATSGTALALGSLLASEEERRPLKLHGYCITRRKLEALVERLSSMSAIQRSLLPPINARRSEIIVPGALILETAMQMLNVDELVLSERALREGLIFDWMLRNGFLEDRFSYQSSIRQRTVMHQAKRFAVDLSRAEWVAKNALILYDKTVDFVHSDTGEGRDLLWAASMLHGCGQHINNTAYHKHSWYLIRHGELLGYSESEHLMVAAIARYHRKSLPKKSHEAWQLLACKEHKKIVLKMSLLLRMAAALDRRPDPLIRSIEVKKTNTNSDLIINLVSDDPGIDLSLEKWSLDNCGQLFHEITGINLIVQIN